MFKRHEKNVTSMYYGAVIIYLLVVLRNYKYGISTSDYIGGVDFLQPPVVEE